MFRALISSSPFHPSTVSRESRQEIESHDKPSPPRPSYPSSQLCESFVVASFTLQLSTASRNVGKSTTTTYQSWDKHSLRWRSWTESGKRWCPKYGYAAFHNRLRKSNQHQILAVRGGGAQNVQSSGLPQSSFFPQVTLPARATNTKYWQSGRR